jgi:hypothetical protein
MRKALSENLLGGVMKSVKEREYIESKDGRQVPYSFLSSGQQELLPLLLVLDVLAQGHFPPSAFYIEEPEAHLFPSAQGLLTEYLTILVNRKMATQLFITTHSPYLLAKFNNLLKAGTVSNTLGKKADSKIDAVVKKDRWIRPGKLAAYSIVDRRVQNLIGEDGLIDGTYLDQASAITAQEFDALLEIEYSDR